MSFSSIPLYLLAGLAFGKGGISPLYISKEFIEIGAEVGVLLLLFMLGLEYSGAQLKHDLRKGLAGGTIDFFLNFPPGFVAGLLMGWEPLPSFLLGGVTYISSSGIIAKVLSDLNRIGCPETSTVLSILVIEDLVMAIYLPLAAVLIVGGDLQRIAISVAIAVVVVLAVLFAAIRYGEWFSTVLAHPSDEIILLTTFGCVLLVAGLAQKVQVSSAIGAFLVGIAVSGPIAEQSHRLLAPLRDLSAAVFFFFFGPFLFRFLRGLFGNIFSGKQGCFPAWSLKPFNTDERRQRSELIKTKVRISFPQHFYDSSASSFPPC